MDPPVEMVAVGPSKLFAYGNDFRSGLYFPLSGKNVKSVEIWKTDLVERKFNQGREFYKS